MHAIVAYIKTRYPSMHGHDIWHMIDGHTSFIFYEGRPLISYCTDHCVQKIEELVKIPFTTFDLCLLNAFRKHSCVCVWCLTPVTSSRYRSLRECKYINFNSLCSTCDGQTRCMKRGIIAKRLLLSTLLLPELAAAIVGLMGRLPARD
jgi:hypothetical protein